MPAYSKAIAAILMSAIGALVVALGTGATSVGDISIQAWLIAVGSVLGSGGFVYFTENGPAAPAIKAILAFLTAGIASLVVGLDDNVLTTAELLTAFAAAVAATGIVYQVRDQEL